jgi:outer membrane lipoprotein-sorting protein
MFVLIIFVTTVFADVNKGFQISVERKNRDRGWGDSHAKFKMVLINKKGGKSTRLLKMKTLEVDDDGDKSLMVFDEPKDIKGTALLSHSHTIEPDDQWLFLPSIKRTKRIASKNKSGPFMGSEFAFEDLNSFELEKYTYRYLGDEDYMGQESFIVEQLPVDEFSGYTWQRVWIDKKYYRPLKVEFYDRKESLLKTLYFDDYKQHLGKHWRAHKMTMKNHQTGNATELVTLNMKFQTGFTDRDFSKASLKRSR